MPVVPDQLNAAVEHHQAGRLAEAERLYRKLLAEDPNHPDLWHLLGVLAYQVGRPAMAVDYIRRAIGLFDRVPTYYGNLAEAYRIQSDFAKAERAFRHAIKLDPDYADALGNFALLLQATGRLDEALVHIDRAAVLRPEHAETHNNRGLLLEQLLQFAAARVAYVTAARLRPGFLAPQQNLELLSTRLRQQGLADEALATFAALVELNPDSPAVLSNWAAALVECQRLDEASMACQKALKIDPLHVEAWSNLGSVHLRHGRLVEAEHCLRKALGFRPDAADALSNLGVLLMRAGRDSESEECLQQAVRLRPDIESAQAALADLWRRQGKSAEADAIVERSRQARFAEVDRWLADGVNLLHCGRPDAAAASFERALNRQPNHAAAHSNYLFCQLYLPNMTPSRLLEAHCEFDRRQVQPLRSTWRPHANSRDPERNVRLGFVSADLRHHPIGFLLARLLEGLDRRQFTPICYSNRSSTCETQTRLRTSAALWRDVDSLRDDRLAEQIREDAVDVLFDLSGHTSGNRLLTFARKPAPVQATWMAYPGTTGVSAIDYLFTDERMTPLGTERYFVEQIVRLPVGAVYAPPESLPVVGPLSAISPESLTLGSFNNPAKLHRGVVRLWSNVLQELPLARLVLKFRGLEEPAEQDRIAGWFADCGVSRRRLEFQGDSPLADMLLEYQRIDVALDPYPYTGGTTTMLALLMGVPVVTLPGETIASRQSLSVLRSIGLDELIAKDAEDYVARVVDLSRNLPRLAQLRASLRSRMLASPYYDANHFGESFAVAVRDVWRRWCQS